MKPKPAPTIIPPIGGWKPRTWYVVEVAFNAWNPVFGAIFFTGFLDGRGQPGGYNEIAGLEDKQTIRDVVFLRALRELTNDVELHQTPNHFLTLSERSNELFASPSVDCTTKVSYELPKKPIL